MQNEISEIKRVQQRLEDLDTEVEQTLCAQTGESVPEAETTLPKVPMHVAMPEPPKSMIPQQTQTSTAETQTTPEESDWLTRMRTQ